jgi:hypothetical protein
VPAARDCFSYIVPFRSQEKKWRGELLRAFGIVRRSSGVAELRPPWRRKFAIPSSFLFRTSAVSILLPKTSQIILDNVVVLDKETASFDAPWARQVNHCQLSTISHE